MQPDQNPVESSLKRGVFANLGGSLFFGLSGFVFAVVLSVSQGASEAGRFWAALALYNIVSRASELGTASGLVRFVSRSSARNDSAEVRVLLRIALVPVLTASVIGSMLLLLIAQVIPGSEQPNVVLMVLAPFVPVAALYTPIVQSLRGFGSMRLNVLIDRFGRGLLQPLSVLVTFALGGSIVWAAFAWGMATLILLVVATWALMSQLSSEAGQPAAESSPRAEFWSFTTPRIFGQLCEVSMLWVDVLIVGLIVGNGAAGVYAAVSRFAIIGVFIAEAIMKVAGPRTAALIEVGEADEVAPLLSQTARAQAGMVWPVYLVLGVFAPEVTSWFGSEFTDGATALRILCAGLLFSSIFGSVSSVVLMSGRSKRALHASVIGLGVNLALNVLLVPTIGMSGAAIAWAASFVTVAGVNAKTANDAGLGFPAFAGLGVAARCTVITGGGTLLLLALMGGGLVTLVAASLLGAINIFGELLKSGLFTRPEDRARVAAPEKLQGRATGPMMKEHS